MMLLAACGGMIAVVAAADGGMLRLLPVDVAVAAC